MKRFILGIILFCFGTFFVNAEAARKEYYDKTTDIKFVAPLELTYTTKDKYPNDIVEGAYYEAVFYNDASRFMIYTVRHCVSDTKFDSKTFSSISKEQMGKGVKGNDYYIKYGYLDASKEETVAIVGTYDDNFYYYMVFIFPKLDDYTKSLIETIVEGTTFGYKKDVTTCEGNTGKENFENNSSNNTNTKKFENYEESSGLYFVSPMKMNYRIISQLPEEMQDNQYADGLFFNDNQTFRVFVYRYCKDDENVKKIFTSDMDIKEMGEGIEKGDYFLIYGYLGDTERAPVAMYGTYDKNYYFLVVFGLPSFSNENKAIVEEMAKSVKFISNSNTTNKCGNESENTDLPNFEFNKETSTNDKYYHPEDEEEEPQEETPVLDYEKENREKKELEQRNMLFKGVLSGVFLLAFVYILGCNKFEFSVFGMFLMIGQLSFIFLLDINLIEGYTINYLYTILYVIPGIISIILLTRKQAKKEVEN